MGKRKVKKRDRKEEDREGGMNRGLLSGFFTML